MTWPRSTASRPCLGVPRPRAAKKRGLHLSRPTPQHEASFCHFFLISRLRDFIFYERLLYDERLPICRVMRAAKQLAASHFAMPTMPGPLEAP